MIIQDFIELIENIYRYWIDDDFFNEFESNNLLSDYLIWYLEYWFHSIGKSRFFFRDFFINPGWIISFYRASQYIIRVLGIDFDGNKEKFIGGKLALFFPQRFFWILTLNQF